MNEKRGEEGNKKKITTNERSLCVNGEQHDDNREIFDWASSSGDALSMFDQ